MSYNPSIYGLVLFIEGLIFTVLASILLYYATNDNEAHNSELNAGIFFIVFGSLSMITSIIMWFVCGDINHSKKRYEIEHLIA